MNSQQIFDTVVTHLRTMPGKAFVQGKGCMYRTPTGNCCAAGKLIKDEEYKPEMEGRNVLGLVANTLFPDRLLPHLHLIVKLQQVHDNDSNWTDNKFNEAGEAWLSEIAHNFSLRYSS